MGTNCSLLFSSSAVDTTASFIGTPPPAWEAACSKDRNGLGFSNVPRAGPVHGLDAALDAPEAVRDRRRLVRIVGVPAVCVAAV